MVKYNLQRYIGAIVALSIIVYIGIASIRKEPFNYNVFWENITSTTTIVGFICVFFTKWAWKWKILQSWLVPFPCLSGKWQGELKSTFKGSVDVIPTEVEIKHTFLNIQIKVKTKESVSSSTCGSFDIDTDRGLNRLTYTYQNIPLATKREASGIHFGTVTLNISECAKEMNGEYWTTRKTTGDITLKKRR